MSLENSWQGISSSAHPVDMDRGVLLLLSPEVHDQLLRFVEGEVIFLAEWEFIKIGFVFEFFVDKCNLWEMCLSNMVIRWTGGYEVQLSFNLILWAVST